MKYGKILDCQKTLSELYDQGISSAGALSGLYDVINDVDAFADKYVSVYNKIIKTHGKENEAEPEKFIFQDGAEEICKEQLESWANTVVPIKGKRKMPIFYPLTLRQYSYLTEFVDFEMEG